MLLLLQLFYNTVPLLQLLLLLLLSIDYIYMKYLLVP